SQRMLRHRPGDHLMNIECPTDVKSGTNWSKSSTVSKMNFCRGGPDRTRTCDLRFRKPQATVENVCLLAHMSRPCPAATIAASNFFIASVASLDTTGWTKQIHDDPFA